jgi:type IV fimbrial biogenesis protein FimT
MKTNSSGFTLFELMLTISILAVIASIGVPGFRDFVRNSRITGAANDIITDFNLARSEAVKRRVPVTLCKSQDGAACDQDVTDPFNSWIVFVDDADPAVASGDDGNGVVDDAEPVLRTRQVAETLDVTTNNDARLMVFMPNGFPNTTVGDRVTQFTLCDDRGNVVSAGGDSAARFVAIQATGRPTVTRNIATITARGGCS